MRLIFYHPLLLYFLSLCFLLNFTSGQPLAVGYIVGIGHPSVALHPVTLAVRKTTTITEVSHGPASSSAQVSHHETTHALVLVPHSSETTSRFRHPIGGFGVGITIGGHGAGHGFFAATAANAL